MAFSKYRDPPAASKKHDSRAQAFVKETLKHAQLGVAKERIGEGLLQKAEQTSGRARKMLQARGENMVREGQAEYKYHLGRARTVNQLIKKRHGG